MLTNLFGKEMKILLNEVRKVGMKRDWRRRKEIVTAPDPFEPFTFNGFISLFEILYHSVENLCHFFCLRFDRTPFYSSSIWSCWKRSFSHSWRFTQVSLRVSKEVGAITWDSLNLLFLASSTMLLWSAAIAGREWTRLQSGFWYSLKNSSRLFKILYRFFCCSYLKIAIGLPSVDVTERYCYFCYLLRLEYYFLAIELLKNWSRMKVGVHDRKIAPVM